MLEINFQFKSKLTYWNDGKPIHEKCLRWVWTHFLFQNPQIQSLEINLLMYEIEMTIYMEVNLLYWHENKPILVTWK